MVLFDRAPWIRIVCEEILYGWNVTFVLDRGASNPKPNLDIPDRNCRTISTLLSWHRDRFEAVAACIRTCEANRDRMRYNLCRTRGLPVGSGIVKAPASASSGTDSNSWGAAGRKRAPTPCSPSDAASKTCVGPTFSNGGLVASQPHDQKKWTAPPKNHSILYADRDNFWMPIDTYQHRQDTRDHQPPDGH